jgi:hypothetical protein
MRFVEPILCRAIAIIPHVKEIINIAFKPFNGIDRLDENDHKSLMNRIEAINAKFEYIKGSITNTGLLDALHRSNLIEHFTLQITRLEKTMLEELITPVFLHLSKGTEGMFLTDNNNFCLYYNNEMKHSLMLPEKSFSINPVKRSMVRRLEGGLDYLMGMHPKRGGMKEFRRDYYLNLYWRSTVQVKHGHPVIDNYSVLDLIGLSTYLWNKLGISKDYFLTQFYSNGLKSTYMVAFPRACRAVIDEKACKDDFLGGIFDRLIIESSLLIRVIEVVTAFDNDLFSFFFPSEPLDEDIARIRMREQENFHHWG